MKRFMIRRIFDMSTITGVLAVLALWATTAAGAQQQKPTNPQLPDPNSQGQQQPASPSTSSPEKQSQGSQLSTEENGQAATSAQNQQTFVGHITKSKDHFVLRDKGSNTTYRLDRQDLAKQYDGRDVRVTGTLDKVDKTIHVSTIEPLST